MKVKTSELEGVALDWAVAISEGHPKAIDTSGLDGPVVICGFKQKMLHSNREGQEWIAYQPSSNWTQGGLIIERENIQWLFDTNNGKRVVIASKFGNCFQHSLGPTQFSLGPTQLIAAMRCFVENRLGSEVEIPDILCNSYI